MRRRGFLSTGAAAMALFAAGHRQALAAGQSRGAGIQRAQPRPSNAERATAAHTAMVRAFSVQELPLLAESAGGGRTNPYAYQWPLSQAIAATLGMAGLPTSGRTYIEEAVERARALDYYWDTVATPAAYSSYVVPPHGHGGDIYYDDNAWTGLQLVQHHRMTGDPYSLQQARAVFIFLVSGWDTDPSHASPGGVFWVIAPWSRDRNTVSTAPSAQLGLNLYEITREPFFLDWATRMYTWVNTTLLAPSGLYWDRITPEGFIETTPWSYNQGSMIGAGVLLSRISGDRSYLTRAERTAEAALDLYLREGLTNQEPAFNAIFFKNLLLLSSANGRAEYREVMQMYADYLWDRQRDPLTNLVHPSHEGGVRLLEQSVLVQLHAHLAWSPADYRLLA